MSDLEDALEEFAIVRSSALTRVIEVLGRAALADFVAPAPKKNVQFQTLWLALVRDPMRRTWCLDMLVEKLPKLGADKQPALVDRLVALRELPPDPRIARAALALLALRSPLVYGSVFEELARIVVQHADGTTAASPDLANFSRSTIAQEILESATLPDPLPLDPEELARWAAVVPAQRDPEELLRSVYAAPEADGPREILADVLQEVGDLRGELIALQLREARGEATEAMRDRATALVQKHGKLWLGALRPIALRAELRRGFLYRLELAGSWKAANWDELARDPSLGTVEVLLPGDASIAIYSQFLRGVAARSVTTIVVEDDHTWATVKTTPMPCLTELRSYEWKGRPEYRERFAKQIVPFLERTPAITRLGCQPEMLSLLSKPLLARLTHLSLLMTLVDGVELWPKFPHLRSLGFDRYHFPIELVREAGDVFARIDAHGNSLVPPLSALPEAIKRIEVHGNATEAKNLAELWERFEVVAMRRPSGIVTGAT
jgi:uncharacterized protein (TIGR02996 family)